MALRESFFLGWITGIKGCLVLKNVMNFAKVVCVH